MSTPYNHRGQPIAGNHRPTPRIAQMLATRIGNDTQARMWEAAPNLYRTTGAPSVEEAQAALDNYRSQRNMDNDHNMAGDVAQTAKYIGETIKMERAGENFRPIKSYKDHPNF